jgi:hypothetical protein
VPDWLAAQGLGRPAETIVDGHLGYASRIYKRQANHSGWRASYSQAAPPEVCRIGLAFPIENDRWIVTLAGGARDYPPVDEKGFADFARSLPNPDIYRVITASEPLSRISSNRGTQNRLRHYEKMRMPAGLVVLGDSACAFNPVYGQGMTTAAIGASLLQECLSNGELHKFQQKLTVALKPAWMFATSEDVRYPGAEGAVMTRGMRFMHRYIDAVLALSIRKPAIRASLLEVLHMLRPASLLFRPGILFRVIAKSLLASLPHGKTIHARRPVTSHASMRTSEG